MADLSSYFSFPGTGNWTSGTTNSGSAATNTTKYFNPQAIYDQLNQLKARSAGTYGLNNSILYGSKPPTYAAGNPYTAPAPPAGKPPAAAPPAGTPPAGAPPTGSPGGPGGGGTPHGPFQQQYSTATAPASTGYGESPQSSVMASTVGGAKTLPDGTKEVSWDQPTATPVTTPSTGGRPIHTAVSLAPGQTVQPHTRPDVPLSATPTIPQEQPYTAPPGTQPPDGSGDTGSGDGLLSALQQLLSGSGYSDAEKQAIQEQGAATLAAQKGSAQAQMANHLASSGNAAGYGGAMSSLDNSAAATAANQARQNTIDFANEGERRKELGASSLEQLLGINTAADLGYMGQAGGLASLGGGSNTTNQSGTSFQNQGFQATPDASAKPGTSSSSGKSGQDATGKTPKDPGYDPKTDPGSKNYDPKKDPLNSEYDPILDPKSPQYNPNAGTDAQGNHPGDANYDPSTDKTNAEYDPTHDPNTPSYDPNYTPGETPGGVLPDPWGPPDTGGPNTDPTGIEGDPNQGGGEPPPDTGGGGDVWAGPQSYATYAAPSNPAAYFSPGATSGGRPLTPAQIAQLARVLGVM